MKYFILLSCLLLAVSSCTVQERFVFDSNMGGTYESSFDLSAMMAMAAANAPKSAEKKTEKVDTLIVFNEFLEEKKDSIATLSPQEQAEIQQMRNMTMRMVVDDSENIFNFTANKTFSEFSEIEFVSNQMDQVFKQVKQQNAAQAGGPGGDMMKTEKVRYTFENNTFRRVDPKVLAEEKSVGEEEPIDGLESDEDGQEDNMMKGMMAEFEDMLAESKMTLQYSFPKKIKSVSKEDAIISNDGKTVTYTVDWKTLLDNKDLLKNFEVVLEE